MGVYEPLTRYLKALDGQVWDASFSDIERIIHRALPPSAFEHRPWWANQKSGNHSQSRAWRDAGWVTCDVDLSSRKVRFERVDSEKASAPRAAKAPLDDLWDRAGRLTGIKDRDELLEAALTALIRREAARQLSALGGTMPDFQVPPRERPTW